MHIIIIVKKTGYLYGFRHGKCKLKNNKITVFHNEAKFDFRLIISYQQKNVLTQILAVFLITWRHF